MSKSFLPILIIALLLSSIDGFAQKRAIYNGISVKGAVGMSTVLGDYSTSKYGSISDGKFGMSLSGIKMFSPFFGIEVKYSTNNLSISRTDLGEQYTGEISEFGMSARIQPIAPIGKNGLRRLYPYGRLGVSNAGFRAIKWNTTTQQIIPPSFGRNLDDLTNAKKVSALSFPLALGIGIRLNNKMSVEIEHNLSILNTDNLDATTGVTDFNDMVGFTNIGLRYSFNPIYESRAPQPKSTRLEQQRIVKDNEYDPVVNNSEEKTGAIDPFKNEIPYSEIYVESIVPEHPISGDLIEVLLRVHKNEYTGPATMLMNLPNGFTAIEAPLRHANMTFKDQQAKIYWSQMPVDSIITQRFHIHIDEKVSGPKVIKGRLWYDQPSGSKSFQFINQIMVNNKNELQMDDKFLNILADQKTSSSPYSTSVVVPGTNPPSGTTNDIDDLINTYEETGQIGARTMDNPLLFGKGTIDRKLYVEGDLDAKIQELIGKPPVTTSPTNKFDPSSLTSPVKSIQTEADLDRQIEQIINGESNASAETPAQGTQQFVGKQGVEFKIQVGAFKLKEEATALVKKHNIKETLSEESHNGLYKYTVGTFSTYKEAQTFRDQFSRQTKLYSVFIVGYKNGVRQSNLSSLR